jgi:hypothetical protein
MMDMEKRWNIGQIGGREGRGRTFHTNPYEWI